nr:hypothetical protein [Shinella zoogloeoides]
MKLTKLVLLVACVGSLAACTSTRQVAASKERLNSTARAIVGTSLIGAHGATASDQDKIDDTVAGLCGSATWTRQECARHDEAMR